MNDLFPDAPPPQPPGEDGPSDHDPVFFAIYPAHDDMLRAREWQEGVCRRHVPGIALRPREILHVSVAGIGRPKQRRQAWADVLAEARRHFSCPAFDIAFDAIARFGAQGRAFAACADAASQMAVRRLQIALADAQRHAGLFESRGRRKAHLTLGYGDGLPTERIAVPRFGFRVAAVDLVVSKVGRTEHVHRDRWILDAP